MTDQHSVTEDITPTSFFSALKSAIKGVVIGGAMFVAAPVILITKKLGTDSTQLATFCAYGG